MDVSFVEGEVAGSCYTCGMSGALSTTTEFQSGIWTLQKAYHMNLHDIMHWGLNDEPARLPLHPDR